MVPLLQVVWLVYHCYCLSKAHIPHTVVIPIIIFTDGTFINVHGQHTPKPIMFMLAIFMMPFAKDLKYGGIFVSLAKMAHQCTLVSTLRRCIEMSLVMMYQIITMIFMYKGMWSFANLNSIQDLAKHIFWQFTIYDETNPTIYWLFPLFCNHWWHYGAQYTSVS